MKLSYFPETDSLYIDLADRPSADSEEIADGIVLDYDENGHLVGIDIDNASHKMNLQEVIMSQMPTGLLKASA